MVSVIEKLTNVVKDLQLKEPLAQVVNIEQLPPEEKLTAEAALALLQHSQGKEFKAACAISADDGSLVSATNQFMGFGQGQDGHAEMVAIRQLFEHAEEGKRKPIPKVIALAASGPNEDVVSISVPYTTDSLSGKTEELECESICGRCLKGIADATGNLITPETGKNDGKVDVTILILTKTGQVFRTSLRTLHPFPFVPRMMEKYPASSEYIFGPPDPESPGFSESAK